MGLLSLQLRSALLLCVLCCGRIWPLPVARDVSGPQASTGGWGLYPKVVLPGTEMSFGFATC